MFSGHKLRWIALLCLAASQVATAETDSDTSTQEPSFTVTQDLNLVSVDARNLLNDGTFA